MCYFWEFVFHARSSDSCYEAMFVILATKLLFILFITSHLNVEPRDEERM